MKSKLLIIIILLAIGCASQSPKTTPANKPAIVKVISGTDTTYVFQYPQPEPKKYKRHNFNPFSKIDTAIVSVYILYCIFK